MDIPYPSQHTMSRNHRPASEMPFKCFRCSCKNGKKEGGGRCVCVCVCGGGGVGDQLESPVETHSIFVVFLFACVVVVVVDDGLGGGG